MEISAVIAFGCGGCVLIYAIVDAENIDVEAKVKNLKDTGEPNKILIPNTIIKMYKLVWRWREKILF